MTLPPRRMYDVWTDFEYDAAETKAERLLMAALDYSVEQHVVYVAARPPRSMFRQLAARMNRKIVYVPLGQLSPAKLKRYEWCTCLIVTRGEQMQSSTSGETGFLRRNRTFTLKLAYFLDRDL